MTTASRVRLRFARVHSRLLGNYWFIPGSMVIVAIGLSFLFPWVDSRTMVTADLIPDWVYGGGPTGARVLLSTIAGSMITVAALVFSITIAGLATASQQFGPRLLRNFINDRGYQLVLGTFLATFAYCLLVLRTVEDNGPTYFVPYLALAVALLLAVAAVGVLVFFIHHAAFSITAETIVSSTGRELREAIGRLYPDKEPRGRHRHKPIRSLPEGFPMGVLEVPALGSGYIQEIGLTGLVALAEKHDLILRLEHRPGHFIAQEGRLLESWPHREMPEELIEELNGCFILGTHRPMVRDVESAVNQLVEIALRSLSPGINDPDTAISCIDQLADALSQAGKRGIPPALLPDTGPVRLITYPLTYSRLVDLAFSRIRQYGRGHVPVTLRLLEVIASLAAHVEHEAGRAALMNQARMLKRSSDESIPEAEDRRFVDARFLAIERALGGEPSSEAAQKGES